MGWTELLVIGIVALIVVGPKDLPGMFKELGKFTARVRSMARDFQRAMEDAADQSGVGDVTKTLRTATNPKSVIGDAMNKATEGLTNWSPDDPVDGPVPGKHTAAFTKERQEAKAKIDAKAAELAQARKDREAAAAAVEEEDPGMVQGDPTPLRVEEPAPEPVAEAADAADQKEAKPT